MYNFVTKNNTMNLNYIFYFDGIITNSFKLVKDTIIKKIEIWEIPKKSIKMTLIL